MKNFLLSVVFLMSFLALAAQSDTTRLGKIVYYEGKVELGNDPVWVSAKINNPVRRNQMIRTSANAMVEVTWTNGSKSIIGPNSRVSAQELFAGSAGAARKNTETVFNDFMNVFNAGAGTKRSEEGGIRRTQTDAETAADKASVYWKQDQEISFDQAFAFYEEGEYGKAIAALEAFLGQKPRDENARYASFALGHSYIMANNPVRAKQIFEQFILDYPNDPLSAEAKKVIAQL